MNMAIFWAVLFGAACITEMHTGTLYLLVVGVAAALAGFLAFSADASVPVQLVGFTLVCVPGVWFLRRRKKAVPHVMASDVGAHAEVLAVRENGTFRVRYSGSDWDAVLVEGSHTDEAPRWLVIVGTQGNLLKCKPAPVKTEA